MKSDTIQDLIIDIDENIKIKTDAVLTNLQNNIEIANFSYSRHTLKDENSPSSIPNSPTRVIENLEENFTFIDQKGFRIKCNRKYFSESDFVVLDQLKEDLYIETFTFDFNISLSILNKFVEFIYKGELVDIPFLDLFSLLEISLTLKNQNLTSSIITKLETEFNNSITLNNSNLNSNESTHNLELLLKTTSKLMVLEFVLIKLTNSKLYPQSEVETMLQKINYFLKISLGNVIMNDKNFNHLISLLRIFFKENSKDNYLFFQVFNNVSNSLEYKNNIFTYKNKISLFELFYQECSFQSNDEKTEFFRNKLKMLISEDIKVEELILYNNFLSSLQLPSSNESKPDYEQSNSNNPKNEKIPEEQPTNPESPLKSYLINLNIKHEDLKSDHLNLKTDYQYLHNKHEDLKSKYDDLISNYKELKTDYENFKDITVNNLNISSICGFQLKKINVNQAVYCCMKIISNKSEVLVTGCGDGTIKIWSLDEDDGNAYKASLIPLDEGNWVEI